MATQGKTARYSLGNVRIPEAALGIFAILLGVYAAAEATGYHDGSTYDSLGPSLLPYIIAGGLILTGLPILLGAFAVREDAAPIEQIDWLPVAIIVAALIVAVLLIVPVGWIPVITVVFVLGARAFGSRRTLLDAAIGLAFGIVTFMVFNFALGLNLPRGWLIARLFG